MVTLPDALLLFRLADAGQTSGVISAAEADAPGPGILRRPRGRKNTSEKSVAYAPNPDEHMKHAAATHVS